jgi:hypothetical protein
MKGEVNFDDRDFFTGNDYPKIIGFNVWLSHENEIIAIQTIYLLANNLHQGYKSSTPTGNLAHYDLKKPDYVKNIGGNSF